jgi:outer membrane protein OmpA-like peptidoglycan-associated protein
MSRLPIVITIAAAATLSACAQDDPHKRAKTGAAIGAVLGGVAGHQVDSKRGRYIGAAVGAIGGAAVGNYMDKQHAEMQRQLAEEAARNELFITRMADGSLRVGLASDVSFDINKAEIKPEAFATYSKIANVLKDYDSTVVHVVGHTDSTGTAEYNQGLSERRAESVARYLVAQALPPERIRQEGRGLRQPVASNATPDGRSKNRRVDIVIKPVVEGQEHLAWEPPGHLGS